MNCRPHGRKPTIAFWMLVAIADTAMLVVKGGPAGPLLSLAAIALVAGTVIAVRRAAPGRTPTTAMTRTRNMTTEVVARRRA